MTVKLLTKHHLEFLSLKGGCAGSSESTLVKMPNCWKSHVAAHYKYTPTSPYAARTKDSDDSSLFVSVPTICGVVVLGPCFVI